MLKVLKATILTDAMLLSSSVAETDHPAWVLGTAYAKGARVIRPGTHSIYQCILAAPTTLTDSPEADTEHWARVGPTNRWAMFDNNVNTRTLGGPSGLTTTVKPGRCNGVALLDMVGATAATLTCSYPIAVQAKATSTVVSQYAFGITLTRVINYAAGTVTQTYAIALENRNVSNWAGYFKNPFINKTDVFIGFNSRSDWTIALSITSANPQVGWMMVGNYIEIGDVGYGVSAGIEDYSLKTTDAWGVTTLVQRDYVKRVTYPVTVDNTFMRQAFSALADLRAKPALFVGAGDYRYTPFTVFGYVASFDVSLSFATYSVINVEVKGLIL